MVIIMIINIFFICAITLSSKYEKESELLYEEYIKKTEKK